MVVIKFFAYLREQVGTSSFRFHLQSEQTVADIRDSLLKKDSKWQALQDQDVLVAVNQTLCSIHTEIKSGDEIAFFPPVTGG